MEVDGSREGSRGRRPETIEEDGGRWEQEAIEVVGK